MKPIALRWLAGRTHKGAVSWGMPWPKGVVKPGTAFTLKNENGGHFVVQTRCRARWFGQVDAAFGDRQRRDVFSKRSRDGTCHAKRVPG